MNCEKNILASAALKRLASNQQCVRNFHEGSELRDILRVPASRYVVAESGAVAIERMSLLAYKGYEIGIEYVGENVINFDEVRHIEGRYKEIIELMPNGGLGRRSELNFDLSNVGLLISYELALEVTERIVKLAGEKGIFVTISMERVSMVDDILRIFHELAASHLNVGITMQAYLHRTPADLELVLRTERKVRLVKGVYAESPEHAMSRSDALDERYLELASRLAKADVARSFATQDPQLIQRLLRTGLLADKAELEMLHGVQPSVMRTLREDGVQCRVYGTFGDNWYLHFLHRLAEAPENILQALADFEDPNRIKFGAEY